tara:strand:+ start:4939 stop:6144 length:1206 start_codon:yes stop_codon:yes gene_type:complete
MIIEIKVPSPGESITEVEIANWLVSDGDFVEKDQEICEIDSDKATLTVSADESGIIKLLKKIETTIQVGEIICTIDSSIKTSSTKKQTISNQTTIVNQEKIDLEPTSTEMKIEKISSPAATKIIRENNIDVALIDGTGKGGRITKQDLVNKRTAMGSVGPNRTETRSRLSTLRRRLSARLVSVKNETAMLTTFNEVDMSSIIELRENYKDKFFKKHDCKLGFMSFFVKSVQLSLHEFPNVNSMIDGEDLVKFNFIDISIAVSSPKGLMVPVLRNVNEIKFFEIEKQIKVLADKARNGKISLDEMIGGTFTITNGGVFGSMLSTPIINPPQSAILGMHNIVERPIVKNGKIEIAPVMYIALSYDHRIIDGKDSVGFLVKVKEGLENPQSILLNDKVIENLGF